MNSDKSRVGREQAARPPEVCSGCHGERVLATRCQDALGDEDLGSDSFWWGEAADEPAREDARPTEMANCVTTKI
jgi:mono/diheme cytochrome c family protein